MMMYVYWVHGASGVIRRAFNFDADGYLDIVDRKEDMIITGSCKVCPAELEDVIYSHPAIHEAAVLGVSDDRWGEAVCAVVVPKHDQPLDEATQRSYLKAP